MGEVRFTPEQLEAIYSKQHEILVSAAAGSGKTAVLVERIVQLILVDQISIDQLVVLTFTNAAASQMKDRIRVRLLAALREADDHDKQYIQKQILLLPVAHISTFHAFCIQVLRTHYQYLDISPNFKIADENDLALIKDDVIDLVLEQFFTEETPDFIHLADYFIPKTSIQPLRQIILTLYEKTRAFAFPQKWQAQTIDWFVNEQMNHELFVKLQAFWQENLQFMLDECQQIKMLLAHYPKNEQMLDELALSISAIMDELQQDWEQGMAALNLFSFPKWPSIKKDDKTAASQLGYDRFTALKKIPDRLLNYQLTEQDIIAQQQQNEPIVKELLHVVNAYEDAFTAEKRQRNLIDFADVEHLMIQLLSQHVEIADVLKSQITEILVDEYQDTNDIQDTILNFLHDESNRIFMVGDVKQSIYRFRLANPQIFMDKYVSFNQEEDETKKLILLNKNFRSANTVLQTINQICQQLFQLDIVYDDDNKLYYGNTSYDAVPDLATTWHYFTNNEEQPIQNETEQKAKYIVGQIIECLNNGVIYDLKTQQNRPLKLQDIALLARNKSSNLLDAIELELERLQIHYSSAVDKGYFDAVEVNNIVALLAVLENPNQDIPLLSFMRSPLGKFTDDELLQLTQFGEEQQHEKIFYQYIMQYLESGTNHDLIKKLQMMLDNLTKYRSMLQITSLAKMLEFIYQDTQYLHFVAALPNGNTRVANLLMLKDIAQGRDEQMQQGLHNFNRYIYKLQTNKRDFAIAKSTKNDADCVQIMTIHKSKGLEFPIVFLVDLDKQFNKSDSRTSYQISDTYGMALRIFDRIEKIKYKSWHYEIIANDQQYLALAEELRVLYVALTRPMQQLHLFLNQKEEKSSSFTKQTVMQINSFATGLRQSYQYLTQTSQEQLNWQTVDVDLSAIVEPIIQRPITSETVIAHQTIADYETIIANWEYQYPKRQLNQFAQKQTVTEIKRQEDIKANTDMSFETNTTIDDTLWQQKPLFVSETQQLSPLDKGTLYHFVLQMYDWESKLPLQQHVEQLYQQQLLTDIEYQILDIAALERIITQVYVDYLDQGYQIIDAEIPFSFTYDAKSIYGAEVGFTTEQVVVQGKIDMLLSNGDEYIIIDYKTDKLLPSQNIQDLERKYQRQLDLYKMAMMKYYETTHVLTKIYAVFA